MGHPPEPACGCRPKNCSSRKKLFFLRAGRAGMDTACAGRGWSHRKQDLLAGQHPPWLHVGQNHAPGTEFIPPRRRPFIVAQQRLAFVHEIPIRISIRVRRLQHYTQILYRQVTRNTKNQRATIKTTDQDLQESRILADPGDPITTTTFLAYPLITFNSSQSRI